MKNDYDIKLVDKWLCPSRMDARVIAMPNIPRPLHCQNPRNILGRSTWDKMRKACYAKAEYKCEICGYEPEKGGCDAHELYDIDYKKGVAKFVGTVCLCRKCHRLGIHTGRCITLFKQGNPLMTKEALLDGAENVFKLIYEYNQRHNKEIRAYSTFLDYLKCDELNEPMRKLINKYEIKFYEEDEKKMAKWAKWKLIIGDTEYHTPYKNEEEWEKAMEEESKKDTARIMHRNLQDKFSGGVYDELNKALSEETALSDIIKIEEEK